MDANEGNLCLAHVRLRNPLILNRYMSFTGVTVTKEFEHISLCLNCLPFDERHTTDNLKDALNNLQKATGITDDENDADDENEANDSIDSDV